MNLTIPFRPQWLETLQDYCCAPGIKLGPAVSPQGKSRIVAGSASYYSPPPG